MLKIYNESTWQICLILIYKIFTLKFVLTFRHLISTEGHSEENSNLEVAVGRAGLAEEGKQGNQVAEGNPPDILDIPLAE